MKPRKDTSLKVRVVASDKLAIMRLAAARRCDVSDLVREAIAQLLAGQKPQNAA